MIRILSVAALLAAAPLAAAPDATALFNAGKYSEAIAAGEAEGSAASLVAAARARLQIAAFSTSDRGKARALVSAANADLARALALAPDSIDVQLQHAIGLGYAAQLDTSPTGAKAMRKALDAIVKRDPNNALAWAALGGWNGGSIAAIGKFIAGSVLGANMANMNSAFAKAMALDPAAPAHPVYYGLLLLNISTDNAPKTRELLAHAATLPARDGFDTVLKSGGAKVQALLASGDVKAAQTLARRSMPFGTVQ